MKRKLLVFMVILFTLVTGMAIITACNKEKESKYQAGDEAGEYYCEVGSAEYTLTLTEDCSITLNMSGEPVIGSYVPNGGVLTVTFGEQTYSASYADHVITMTYNNVALRFLRKVNYTVTFDTEGGSAVPALSVLNGKTAEAPEQGPTLANKVFVGWYTDTEHKNLFNFNRPITSDLTLHARYVDAVVGEEYTVTFVSGEGATEIAAKQTIGGVLYAAPAPEKEGAEFVGWWVSHYGEASKLTYKYNEQKLSGDTTLYAVWKSEAPVVSVEQDDITWSASGTLNNYTVVITGPNGDEVFRLTSDKTSLTKTDFDFSAQAAGDYVVSVSLGTNTTNAYFRNKQLAKPTALRVSESTLLFNPVENATSYTLSMTCGTLGHSHTSIELGNRTSYDFSACEMPKGGFTFTVTAKNEGWLSATSELVFDRKLETVKDLTVTAEDVATWSPVDHATSYYVTLLLDTKEVWKGYVYDESLSLENYGAGKYTLRVFPVARGWTSPAEAELGYEKVRLSTPSGLKLSGGTVSWTAVPGADHYSVTIGDTKFETEAGATSFEFALHLVEGVSEYTVSVSACNANPAAESLPSEPLTVHSLQDANEFPKTLKYYAGVLSWEPALNVEKYLVTVGVTTYESAEQCLNVEFTETGDTTITLRAKFTDGTLSPLQSISVHVYRLAFDAQFGEPVGTVYLAKGDPVPAAVTERYGYTFAGWYTDPAGAAKGGVKFEDTLYSDDNDLTLYANWLANKYQATLNEGSNGEPVDDVLVEFNEEYTLPVPEAKTEEMAFAGWYSQPNGAGTQYTDKDGVALRPWTDEARSLYAYWVELFTFSKVEGGYAVSKGVGIGFVEEITIPQTHLGEPVVAISDFSSTATLKTVNFYDTINTITVGSVGIAFEGCNNLDSINVLQAEGNHTRRFFSVDGILLTHNEITGDVEIYYYPGHHVLEENTFYVPDVVTRLTSGWLPQDSSALSTVNPWTIHKIVVPASVTHVSADAFYNHNILREITFLDPEEGEGEELTFENGAFHKVNSLQTVNLPARLASSFSGSAFDFTEESSYGLGRLTTLTVPDNAKHFVMIEGLVCRKTADNGRELVLYPLPYKQPAPSTSALTVSEIIIPEGVTSIPSDAIPKGVKMTSPINNVKKIEIARTVTNIGAGAFDTKAQPYNIPDGFKNVTELIFKSTAADPDLTIGARAFYRFPNKDLKITVETANGPSTQEKLIYVLPENLVNLGSYAFGSYYASGFKEAVVNCGSNNRTLNFSVNAFASDEGTTHTSTITIVRLGQYVHGVNIAAVFGAKVADVKVDPANQQITDANGVLFNHEMTEILFYPADVTKYDVPDTVTQIGDNLFANRTTLTAISLPATLTSIGSGAFSGCTKLATVTFRKDLDADSAEKGLQKATSLTIGDSAFYNCNELLTLELPERTVSIGASSFSSSGTSKLKTVTLNEGLKTIGTQAFAKTSLTTVELPASLEELGVGSLSSGTDGATVNYETMDVFLSCNSLTTITVKDGNTHFKAIDGVLYGLEESVPTSLIFCPGAKTGTVTVPETVKVICSYAFGGTSVSASKVTEVKFAEEVDELVLEPYAFGQANITDLHLPKGTTEIGRVALGSTSTLTSVFIPNTVTKIGFKAFNGCTKLKTVTFEKGGDAELMIEGGYNPSTIWASLRSGFSLFSGSAPITALELPERITHIDDFVFSGMLKLESLTLPKSVETVGIGSFAGCTALAELVFPADSALREVGYRAFYDLTALTELKLPASMRTIGDQAFTYNLKGGNLESLTLNEGLETIGVAAFMGLRVSELTIPASVKRIEGSAFGYGNALSSVASWQPLVNLTKVTFAPNSQIEYIGKSAFAFNPDKPNDPNLTKLATVNFGNPVNPFEIGENVFENCIALESITLPATLKTIASSAFLSCTGLKTVNFASGMTKLESVGANAFQNTAITEITFPESENGIELGQTLFNKNTTAVTYHLSASVKSINNTFAGCAIEDITVDEDSIYFSVDEEQPILYDADGSVMMVFGAIEGDLTIGLGAFEIGASAFANQTGITSVYIPASVVTINKSAFEGCTNLVKVTIQASSALESIAGKAFAGCTNLASINLEATSHLTHLGASAFKNCPGLTSVDLSRNENLQILGTNLGISSGSGAAGFLFQNDGALETVKLPKSITTLGTSGFEGTALTTLDLSQMTDMTGIGGTLAISANSSAENTFKNCKSLTTVRLPASVGAIGANAFEGCSALTTINLDNIAVFGKQAFSGCGLKSLTLPVIKVTGYSSSYTYTNMGDNVFENNTQLTSLTIPEGVNALYKQAFKGCTALQEVVFPVSFRMSDVATSSAYSGYSGMFSGCTALKKVTFKAPELDAIPSDMFSGCESLATVDFNDVHAIKSNAFKGTALTSFTIGASTETVDASVFANITTLTKLTIKSEHVSIGNYAFQNSGLTEVDFPENTSDITFGNNVFDGCQFVNFEVPNAKSIGTYFLANNAKLKNVTFADDFNLERLPNYMLQNCTAITSFTFPNCVKDTGSGILSGSGITTINFNKVTTIGRHAFEKTPIKQVTIPAQIEAFAGNEGTTQGGHQFSQCKQLTKVVFEDACKLELLEKYAFAECDALQSVKLPKGLKQIAEYAFSKCVALTEVDFNGNTVFEGFTSSHTFDGCTELANITLPTSMKYTGSYTFVGTKLSKVDWSNMTNLQALGTSSATLPTSVANGYLFQNCTALTEVKLPETVVWLSGHLFDGCTQLEGFVLPAKLQAIGTQFCMPLSGDIVLPETVKIVATQAFDGSHITSIDMSACKNLLYLGTSSATTKVTSATTACSVFANCAELTSVKLPTDLVGFGKELFKGCTKLKSVELPATLTVIGNNAFEGSGITHIELPAALKTLGTNVFKDCADLKLVYIPKDMQVAKTTSGFNANVFTNCKGFTVYTDGKVADVQKNWAALKNLTVVGDTTLEDYKNLDDYKALLPKTEEAEEPKEGPKEGTEEGAEEGTVA